MKLKEIARLIGQREVVEGDEAKAMASAPVNSDEMETIVALGNQLGTRVPNREVMMAVGAVCKGK